MAAPKPESGHFLLARTTPLISADEILRNVLKCISSVTQLEVSSVLALTAGVCPQVFLPPVSRCSIIICEIKFKAFQVSQLAEIEFNILYIKTITQRWDADILRQQLRLPNTYQRIKRVITVLLSFSMLSKGMQSHPRIYNRCACCRAVPVSAFLRVPVAFRVWLHFCCICHQSTLTSGCTLTQLAFFELLPLCFGGDELPLSDLVIFLNVFPPALVWPMSERPAVQKGAGCHGKLPPLSASQVESVSCSFQPLISVPDIVPRVLIELNSLDTGAHLRCPVVLSHVHTVRIFLNCFPR